MKGFQKNQSREKNTPSIINNHNSNTSEEGFSIAPPDFNPVIQKKDPNGNIENTEDKSVFKLEHTPIFGGSPPNEGHGNYPNQNKPFQLKKGDSMANDHTNELPNKDYSHDYSNINIHTNSQNAKDIGALAYTQGTNIHFAPGQFKPEASEGRALIGHEIKHVEQQAQGKVKATTQAKGLPVNDNPALEREADQAGKQAANSNIPFQNLLSGGPSSLSGPIQMKPEGQGFTGWWQSLIQTGEAVVKDVSSDNTNKSEDNYHGTDHKILNADGTHQTSKTSGYEQSAKDVWSFSGFNRTLQYYLYQNDEKTGGTNKSGGTETSSFNRDGSYSKTTTTENTTTFTDHDKTAEAVKKAITDQSQAINLRAGELQTQVKSLESDIKIAELMQMFRNSESEEYKKQQEYIQNLKSKKITIQSMASQMSEKSTQLIGLSEQVTAENAGKMAAQAKVHVETVNKVIGEKTTSLTKLDVKNLSYTSGTTTEKMTHDGVKVKSEDSASTKLDIGQGARVTTGEKKGETITGPDGKSHEKSLETKKTHGIVAKEDSELGYMQGKESTKVDGTSTTTKSKKAELTNKGGYLSGELGKTKKGDKLTTGVKASADGSIVLDVKSTNTNPPEYIMTLSVKVGGSLGVSAGQTQNEKSKTSAEVSANAGASAELIYAHKMNKAEASQYIEKLAKYDNGSKSGGKMPEFDILDRLTVLKDQVKNGQMLDAASLLSSKSGASMASGDSVELTLTGNANVSGKVGAKSGTFGSGAEAGASWERIRKLKIAKGEENGKKHVDVTVAFSGKDGWNAGGNLSVYSVGMKVGYKEDKSGGLDATFRLNPESPDFNNMYNQILTISSREALKVISTSEKYRNHLASLTKSNGDSSEETMGVSVPGVELGIGWGSAYAESVTMGKDGMSGEFKGSSHTQGSLGIGGVNVANSKTTSTGTANVGSDGSVDIDLNQTTVDSSIFNSSGEKKPNKSWTDYIAKTPKQQVEEKINTTLTSMWGITMDNKALETVISRARSSKANWSHCMAGSMDTMLAWGSLRNQLIYPQPSKEWSEKDPELAKKLYRAQAIAQFMKGSGAINCIRRCLREWGEYSSGLTGPSKYGYYNGGAEDAGSLYEWPSSLIAKKSEFDNTKKYVADLEGKVENLRNAPEEEQNKFDNEFNKHFYFLVHFPAKIESASHSIPRAKMEMINSVRELRLKLNLLRIRVFDKEDKFKGDVFNRTAHQINISNNLNLFREFKNQETILYSKMDDEADDYFVDEMDILRNCSKLDNVHEYWITKIKQTRASYSALNVPESDWKISTGPDKPRVTSKEPDIEKLNKYWLKVQWGKHEAKRDNRLREMYNNSY